MRREEYPRNAKIDLDLVAADVISKESLRSKKSESWMNYIWRVCSSADRIHPKTFSH